jgi:hypothetical protein
VQRIRTELRTHRGSELDKRLKEIEDFIDDECTPVESEENARDAINFIDYQIQSPQNLIFPQSKEEVDWAFVAHKIAVYYNMDPSVLAKEALENPRRFAVDFKNDLTKQQFKQLMEKRHGLDHVPQKIVIEDGTEEHWVGPQKAGKRS